MKKLSKIIKATIIGFCRRMYRFSLAFINIPLFYLFHKKLSRLSNTKDFWVNRKEADYLQIPEIEKDPYYINLDNRILSKLRELDSPAYLEVGCYFGYRLNKFSRELKNKKFIGIDIGFDNLSFGREKKVVSNLNTTLINADAAALPFKDCSLETVYTVVSLTHIDYSKIQKVIKELIRVCAKNLLLVEADHRKMTLKNKIRYLNWDYGYMHPYEKIIAEEMGVVSIVPIYDLKHHPRYTIFQFLK